jgi:tetratricopeptide (TPR) repeat protein
MACALSLKSFFEGGNLMAVCTVCGGIFNNETGYCPECGAEFKVETGGKNASDLFKEAMLRIEAGQVIDAKGLLTQAIKMDENNGRFHFYLGSVLYKQKDYEKAYTSWQKADRLLPNNDRIQKCLVAARQRNTENKK